MTGFGTVSLKAGSFPEARQWFEDALAIYEEIGDRHWQTLVTLRLGMAHVGLDEIDLAIARWQQGAALARTIDGTPNLRPLLSSLTDVFRARQDFAAAAACLDELLTLSPDDRQLRHERANVNIELEDFAAALADYQHLLDLDANDGWAQNGLGSVLDRQEDFEGALAAYSRAISMAPEEAAFARNRASVLLALGRLDEAEADCETAARLAPDHPFTHGRWGDLYLARGQWHEAEVRFRAALAQDGSPGWRFGLVVALWGMDQMEDGWQEFRTAAADADAHTRFEAARDYRRLVAIHPNLVSLREALDQLSVSSVAPA